MGTVDEFTVVLPQPLGLLEGGPQGGDDLLVRVGHLVLHVPRSACAQASKRGPEGLVRLEGEGLPLARSL